MELKDKIKVDIIKESKSLVNMINLAANQLSELEPNLAKDTITQLKKKLYQDNFLQTLELTFASVTNTPTFRFEDLFKRLNDLNDAGQNHVLSLIDLEFSKIFVRINTKFPDVDKTVDEFYKVAQEF